MLETLSKYKLIIWGTGSAGIELKHYLNAAGINILCFCDNDKKNMAKQLIIRRLYLQSNFQRIFQKNYLFVLQVIGQEKSLFSLKILGLETILI